MKLRSTDPRSVYVGDPRSPEGVNSLRSVSFPLWEPAESGRQVRSMGMPMCQNRMAVPTWSFAMERALPAQLVEIGTYSGGLATALALHALCIKATITTYDIAPPSEDIKPIGERLGVRFRTISCWDAEDEIRAIVQRPGPTFVLCDGGDKKREFAVFAKHLKVGDVIAAHDYDAGHEVGQEPMERAWPWSEIRREDVTTAVRENGLEPFMQVHMDLAGWLAFARARVS